MLSSVSSNPSQPETDDQLYGNDNSLMFTDDFTKRTVNDLVYVFYDTVLMLWLVGLHSPGSKNWLMGS
jgi:hypothetical protein